MLPGWLSLCRMSFDIQVNGMNHLSIRLTLFSRKIGEKDDQVPHRDHSHHFSVLGNS